ncbi:MULTISPECIES: EAL domain-containing protein [Comamonadaceae]|uniref:EAL domain-containing protein n=1 Tax=Acidovorax sacchari TaxID=3230736 RepID=UPI0034A4B45C
MLEIIAHAWRVELANYPLLLLQAAALLGTVSMVLVTSRQNAVGMGSGRAFHGIVFGLAGFLMIAMAQSFLQQTSKPYLASDLLFLGGLLGGWRGGPITLASVVAARLLFGGTHQISAFTLDMSVTMAGGVLMNKVYRDKPFTEFRGSDTFRIWAARMACSLVASAAVFALQLVPAEVSVHVVTLQVLGFTVSLLILAGTIALLRSDAMVRQTCAQRMQLYRTDLLTGLPNRRALAEHLEGLLSAGSAPHTMIVFEIGNLKEVVSMLGHDWTDRFWGYLARKVLQGETASLSREVPQCFQFSDMALAFIVEGMPVQQLEHRETLPKIHADLAEDFGRAGSPYAGVQLRYRAFNLRQDADERPSSVLRNISLALQSSTQQYRYFHTSFSSQTEKDAAVRELLIDWIRRVDAPMCYQPKFDLRSKAMYGAEALLRAKSVDGQPLPPTYVFDVASRCQLLLKLEWCTIEVVVREIGRCLASGIRIPLSVNISAESMTVPGFGERVIDCLRTQSVPFHLLSLEIIESGHLPDIETVHTNIHHLHTAGVGLSLDDFGTGYSALSTLAKFPFSEVKIDYAMVSMVEEPRMQKAIGLAFESARQYGAVLVAEGVETEVQSALLCQMGIYFGQGYLFSRALPMHDVLALPRSGPATA